MSFEKFFKKISRLIPDAPFAVQPDAIARLNPNKIYLENVRSVLGVSSGSAERICETAVRQGVFSKYVEVVGPDGAAAASARTEAELPETVRCWQQEHGNYEEVEIPTRELSKTTFYRLNDVESLAGTHTRTA